MDERYVVAMREKLAGRDKRQLIEGMIVRSPHRVATEKLVLALEAYPLLLLLLAHDLPTQIWLLDRRERPSSAAILTDELRAKRWHSWGVTLDECEGLTEVVGGQVVVVMSWKTLLIMRHEFAHAVTTFLTPDARGHLALLYTRARQRGSFAEPLAAESIGEYVACGLSYHFFPDLSAELRAVDAALYRYVEGLLRKAEQISDLIASPRAVAGPVEVWPAGDRIKALAGAGPMPRYGSDWWGGVFGKHDGGWTRKGARRT